MSYVEYCKKHGQYHGEICGECFEDVKKENIQLRDAINEISAKTFSFVMNKDNATDILLVVRPIRDICNKIRQKIK